MDVLANEYCVGCVVYTAAGGAACTAAARDSRLVGPKSFFLGGMGGGVPFW